MATRVAVVVDEELVRETLIDTLEQAGLTTVGYGDCESALAGMRRDPPDLVLLDLGVSRIHGLEMCRRLRADPPTSQVAVLMLTAIASDAQRALEIGADDYLVKPWRPRLLLARIRSVLRRVPPTSTGASRLTVGSVVFYPVRREASVGGHRVKLPPTEYSLLYLLASKAGRVLSREEIQQVQQPGDNLNPRGVDVLISGLRHKLGDQEGIIVTVRGGGYKLVPPAT